MRMLTDVLDDLNNEIATLKADLDKWKAEARYVVQHVKDRDEVIAALTAERDRFAEVAEMLWVVLANVSGGDWTLQSAEWQEAAARWRDNYFAALDSPTDKEPT